MIDLYYWTTPNGHKIAIFLEETGLPYNIMPVNIGKGEQFKSQFLAVSPNNRIPALVDQAPPGGGKPIARHVKSAAAFCEQLEVEKLRRRPRARSIVDQLRSRTAPFENEASLAGAFGKDI